MATAIPANMTGNETTQFALDNAEQAAAVRRWERAIVAKKKEIAAREKRGALTSNVSGYTLALSALYGDLAHQYRQLSDAQHGVHTDASAQRRNAKRNGWD